MKIIRQLLRDLVNSNVIDNTFNFLGKITLVSIVAATARSRDSLTERAVIGAVAIILIMLAAFSYISKLNILVTIYRQKPCPLKLVAFLIVATIAGILVYYMSDFLILVAESMLPGS